MFFFFIILLYQSHVRNISQDPSQMDITWHGNHGCEILLKNVNNPNQKSGTRFFEIYFFEHRWSTKSGKVVRTRLDIKSRSLAGSELGLESGPTRLDINSLNRTHSEQVGINKRWRGCVRGHKNCDVSLWPFSSPSDFSCFDFLLTLKLSNRVLISLVRFLRVACYTLVFHI